MNPNDPQFIYLILVLPALFGMVLIGDGTNKLIHNHEHGLISLIFGITFLAIVVLGYLFFSTYLIGSIK
ncbi:MAG TPA: hypothetical protein VI819_02885 [Patescibacteria group bacterium]|nr:hypothetical protein [Patescibacteria group bacterium]